MPNVDFKSHRLRKQKAPLKRAFFLFAETVVLEPMSGFKTRTAAVITSACEAAPPTRRTVSANAMSQVVVQRGLGTSFTFRPPLGGRFVVLGAGSREWVLGAGRQSRNLRPPTVCPQLQLPERLSMSAASRASANARSDDVPATRLQASVTCWLCRSVLQPRWSLDGASERPARRKGSFPERCWRWR
jgi:hypothetical protein